jgi:tetratricopeptide (TPR) repeat protein
MFMKSIFTLLLCGLWCVSIACLNERHVSKHGKESIHDELSLKNLQFNKSHNINELETFIKNIKSEQATTEEEIFDNQNNIAIALIKLGRLDEAEKILDNLIKQKLNDYSVTINLGTLYELKGNNQKALNLIKKAIQINPDSHSGSEWFHVKILEAKLKNLSNQDLIKADILGLKNRKVYATTTSSNIAYQLQERIPFTKAPNLLMAKVLQEYGDFVADSISISAAYVAYEIGMDYDRENLLQLKEKKQNLLPYFKKYNESIPVTGNYYVDGAITAANENKIEIATSILDKGISFFSDREEKRKQEERKKKMIYIGGAILAASTFFFILFKRKKNNSKKE